MRVQDYSELQLGGSSPPWAGRVGARVYQAELAVEVAKLVTARALGGEQKGRCVAKPSLKKNKPVAESLLILWVKPNEEGT